MNIKKLQAALSIIESHHRDGPDLQVVYIIQDTSKEIRLLEITYSTPRNGEIHPVRFGPSADIPYTTAIISMHPATWRDRTERGWERHFGPEEWPIDFRILVHLDHSEEAKSSLDTNRTMSIALPKDHWIYTPDESFEPPYPMPGSKGENRHKDRMAKNLTKASREAIRRATMNGAEKDFDPDALVQNLLVAVMGPWRSAGGDGSAGSAGSDDGSGGGSGGGSGEGTPTIAKDLAYQFINLPHAYQVAVAKKLGIEDQVLSDGALFRVLFRRASEGLLLDVLRKETEKFSAMVASSEVARIRTEAHTEAARIKTALDDGVAQVKEHGLQVDQKTVAELKSIGSLIPKDESKRLPFRSLRRITKPGIYYCSVPELEGIKGGPVALEKFHAYEGPEIGDFYITSRYGSVPAELKKVGALWLEVKESIITGKKYLFFYWHKNKP